MWVGGWGFHSNLWLWVGGWGSPIDSVCVAGCLGFTLLFCVLVGVCVSTIHAMCVGGWFGGYYPFPVHVMICVPNFGIILVWHDTPSPPKPSAFPESYTLRLHRMATGTPNSLPNRCLRTRSAEPVGGNICPPCARLRVRGLQRAQFPLRRLALFGKSLGQDHDFETKVCQIRQVSGPTTRI